MQKPHAVLFDLDETLAESFQAPTAKVSALFESLLSYIPLAIITAASFERVQTRFVSTLSPNADLSWLFILSDSSAEAYRYNNMVWNKLYDHTFPEAERAAIVAALEDITQAQGWDQFTSHGPRILSRDSQITYAALGIEATLEEKKGFDPDRSKREKVREALSFQFPDCEIKVGGSTSIDISPKGLDKAHGVIWLAEVLKCTPEDMLYVGDSFHEGGNDAAVIPTGIHCREVSGPQETEVVLTELLSQFT